MTYPNMDRNSFKHGIFRLRITARLASLLCVLVASALVASAQDYTTVKLPTLGGKFTTANAINDDGLVVGSSDLPTNVSEPFVWSKASGIQDLGTLGSPQGGTAYAINSSGWIAGSSFNSTGLPHAFLWIPQNGMTDLGTLGGADSIGFGINRWGQVVGSTTLTSIEQVDAFYWSHTGGMLDLGSLTGTLSGASGLNDSGQVVGYVIFADGTTHPFVWTAANGMQDLGTLGGVSAGATGINNQGQVAGSSNTTSGVVHAFLWTQANGMQDLGALPGDDSSTASAITESGQIVGTSFISGVKGGRPFVWSKNAGMLPLMIGNPIITTAKGMNAAGQIISSYFDSHGSPSFLSTPIMFATIASSPNPSDVGESVAITATVSSAVGSAVVSLPPDGETVTITDGGDVLAVIPLIKGSATFNATDFAKRTHSLRASYGGDANYASSKSSLLNQVVNANSTSTSLVSNLNPSIYGQPLTWTTQVASLGTSVPSGKVTLDWNGSSITFAILDSSGVATLSKSTLNASSYSLIAVYHGDSANAGSSSAVLTQVVQQTPTSATLGSSTNPSKQGQNVTFTAQITSPTVTPTGPVTFVAGSTLLGTAQLSGGKAKVVTSMLPLGSTTIVITYAGSSNILASSASLTQTVQ